MTPNTATPSSPTPQSSHYPNDQWTLDLEELGFDADAKELTQMVLLCKPPFAVAVNGRWGSGKTSLMRYVMTALGGDTSSTRIPYQGDEHEDRNYNVSDSNQLSSIKKIGQSLMKALKFHSLFAETTDENTNNDADNTSEMKGQIVTLWFSPWSYQNDINPMIPLLHALREKLSGWVQLSNSLTKSAKAVAFAGLDILGHLLDTVSTIAGAKTKAFSEIGKATHRELHAQDAANLDIKTDTERFNLLFEHAIAQILGAKIASDDTSRPNATESEHRLVIFIDDLDRCEGSVAIKMLEAIKLYLSTRYCVFVLGLDFTALEHSIECHWKDHPKGLAREYLDKLFQSVYHVPVSQRYPTFIQNRLVEQHLLPDSSPSPGIAPLAEIIAAILEPNPRKIKNFLNSLRVAWKIAQQAYSLDDVDLPHFAMIQKLRMHTPATYAFLRQHPAENNRHFRGFLSSCITRTPLEQKAGWDVAELFQHDWGHLVHSEDKDHRLGLKELRVRLDRLAADMRFARLWMEGKSSEDSAPLLDEMDAARFSRCLGIPAPP